jgi:pimeloyl-ACP methyl ester carboxylesterase
LIFFSWCGINSLEFKNKQYGRKKMRLHKRVFIFNLLVMVAFASLVTAAPEGDEVEAIYERIRQVGPRFQWEAREVTFQNLGMNLKGTLTVPKVNRSCPIILILHGFGGERTGFLVEGTGEGYFERFARIAAEQGFCSLRFDFRGSGESDGTYDITSFTGQRCDAIAAIDFMRRLGDPVNRHKLGVVGHSQGGLVAALTAAADERVDSLVLWAAVGFPAHDFGGILLDEGLKAGLALPDGGTITLGLYVNGEYIDWDMTLGKQFFLELFSESPIIAARDYRNPLMYVSCLQDDIVWPQPHVGSAYLKNHTGIERLVAVDAGHNFSYYNGPEKLDEIIYWTIAWFIETLE